MKTLHKKLLLTALLAAPFAAAQAHDDDAAHRAWLKAQQIDIKPTLTIKETEIPAGSAASSTGTGSPAGTSAPSSMPASPSAPPSTMPSSPGTYSPGAQPSGTPVYPAPIENHPGMNSGPGVPAK
ncbi:hypothetical protein [Pollutimonas sp. M17]|uniref:hypothetical protein n=1 Tax=Pollutimonas sp. M17 TaxID=2962065 RepID=UPI0021F49F9A|nr:hypothetical protein [Pollutimonas sp. M17]UYO94651.1 hypothetical protein OEG81_04815 [Pollutimonas sp. M17]